MAGIAREQVCTYMCPYARFQAVMFDRDTLIVSYDRERGDGAAGRARLGAELKTRDQRQARGVGDCICGRMRFKRARVRAPKPKQEENVHNLCIATAETRRAITVRAI